MTRAKTGHAITLGEPYGWLTPFEHLSRGKCRCTCKCGAVVLRDEINLRSSRITAQVPKCKQCERKERKRKNPGGGVPTNLVYRGGWE